ncbi:MAG: flagellar type III secretion system pore protein FliP [Phycisphaerae bacterium]|nr:flagellar type III secretion system pore protein FliP [Phycisphaerae bacterium]
MRRRLVIAALAAVILAGPGRCRAQETDGEADEATAADSVPNMGQVLEGIDKATKTPEGEPSEWSGPIKLAVVFAGLAVLPSLLVMMTAFTRIVIVLGFIRRALTTQNIPPTIAIIGLGLFLTLFTMAPTLGTINRQAMQPYLSDEIGFDEAIVRGNDLLKDFMLRQTRPSDLKLFVSMAEIPMPETRAEVPTYVAIPSFAVSEFRTAFEMGCLLFIPFLLVDLVVASILLSAGMMMLPPAMISLPFKIVLFVLVDGWHLLAEALVNSFH